MLTDIQKVPLPIRAVQLIFGTERDRRGGFEKSPQGLAIQRLRSDPRWKLKILGGLPKDKFNEALRDFWYEQLSKMMNNPSGLDGLVWIHDDVVLEDFLLAEHLAEAWACHDSIILRSPGGEVVLWALSLAGVRRWLQPFAANTDAENKAGQKAHQAKAQELRHVVEVISTDQGLGFPAAELHHAESSGVTGAAWALGVSELVLGDSGRKRVQPVIPPTAVWEGLPSLRVVCATREPQERFLSHTLTGQSLHRMKQSGVDLQTTVVCSNQSGLPTIYNKVISQENAGSILLFLHDDVWINDLWLSQRLHEGLLRYDVLGVAGNRQRVPNQPAWSFPKRSGQWDTADNLLGQVAHCTEKDKMHHATAKVSRYGNARRGPARLMDGVLLAARCDVLLRSGVRFDERFLFHFYDLDFCRTAEQRGLRLGVWPMAITHASAGRFGGQDWLASYGSYVGKWQD